MEWFQEYVHIMTDPAHLLTDLTWSAGEFVVGFLVGRKFLRRHDRDVHHMEEAK